MAVLAAVAFIGFVGNRKLLPVLAVFLLTWQLIVPNAVKERVFMTENSNGELEPSAGDRVTIWENAMEIIKGNPVIGTGFDTYKFMHAVGPYEDTHNYYVKVMLETGIVGMMIFLAIVSQMFRAGFALYRNPQADEFLRGVGLGVAALLVAAIVGNFFGDRWSYIEETGFTWVFVAMALRGTMLTQEQAAIAEAPESDALALPLAYMERSAKSSMGPAPTTSR